MAVQQAGSVTPEAVARAGFERAFGHSAQGLVQAPGRVNLIGEHTDYNDGFALPCALGFRTAVAWRLRTDGRVGVVAQGWSHEPQWLDPAQLSCGSPVDWIDYVRAMLWAWQERGWALPGLELAIAGDVPQGAGLSSSAALEVALGTALAQATGQHPGATALALLAQRAENAFVGCHCGNMDQLISAHGRAGHALLLDCRTLELTPVPLPEAVTVLVIDSRVQRGLVDSAYNERRRQCEEAAQVLGVKALRDVSSSTLLEQAHRLHPLVLRRARHVVTENERTLQAARALEASDLQALGALMADSHRSMREDFEITVPPIDRIVEVVARELQGQGGVRMTGGGFGGCVVALLPDDRVEAVRAALEVHYRSPQGESARVYSCRAAAGAGPI